MGRPKSAPWIVGAVVVAFLAMAGAWFLAIAPRLDSAASMTDEASSELARVDQLEIQLAGLERDAANLADFRTELEGLREQVPADVELSELTRELQALATESGVQILSVTPATPTELVPAEEPAPPPVEATDGTTDGTDAGSATVDGTGGSEATTPTTPAAAQGVDGLYVVPLEIGTLGGYEETLAFLTRLQTGGTRLVLVSRITATSQEESGAEGGRPAVAAGDLELRFTAYVFVLTESDADVVDEEPVDPEPAPSGGPNPFEPLH